MRCARDRRRSWPASVALTLVLLTAPALAEAQPRVRVGGGGIEVVTAQAGVETVIGRLAFAGPVYDLLRLGNTVFVARGLSGVTAVDVTRPEAPRELSTFANMGRPVVKLAAAGGQLVAIVADYASLLFDVADPSRPVFALPALPNAGPLLTAATSPHSPGAAPALASATPAPTEALANGLVIAVRAGQAAIRAPGLRVGSRFELRSQEALKTVDPVTGAERSLPSQERLGVVEIERLEGDAGIARLPRGLHATVGDLAVPTQEPRVASLIDPSGWRGGMFRLAGTFRPFLSMERLGFGLASSLSLDYYFKSPVRIGVELAPFSFLAQSGGTGVDGHVRGSAAYSVNYFEVGGGVGGHFQAQGSAANAFAITLRVRLGSLDGLHLIFQSELALVSNGDSRKFTHAASFGELAFPLTQRLTLIFEGGGGSSFAYGMVSLATYLTGNGGPGTLIIHGGIGGAAVTDPGSSCDAFACNGSGQRINGAGPAASIGFDYRF